MIHPACQSPTIYDLIYYLDLMGEIPYESTNQLEFWHVNSGEFIGLGSYSTKKNMVPFNQSNDEWLLNGFHTV